MKIYNEVILDLRPDLNDFIDRIHEQYPSISKDDIRTLYVDIAHENLSKDNEILREKELELLSKFQNK